MGHLQGRRHRFDELHQFEYRDRLEDVIQEAKRQGIVTTCSNHDEGANPKTTYPAAYCPNTWEVTACDEYGFTPSEREPPKGAGRYTFQGLNIPAGVIQFLESNDRISGSFRHIWQTPTCPR